MTKKMQTQYSDKGCKCQMLRITPKYGKPYWTPIFCDACKNASHERWQLQACAYQAKT